MILITISLIIAIREDLSMLDKLLDETDFLCPINALLLEMAAECNSLTIELYKTHLLVTTPSCGTVPTLPVLRISFSVFTTSDCATGKR